MMLLAEVGGRLSSAWRRGAWSGETEGSEPETHRTIANCRCELRSVKTRSDVSLFSSACEGGTMGQRGEIEGKGEEKDEMYRSSLLNLINLDLDVVIFEVLRAWRGGTSACGVRLFATTSHVQRKREGQTERKYTNSPS